MNLAGPPLDGLLRQLPRLPLWLPAGLAALLLSLLFPGPAIATAGFVASNLASMAPLVLLAAALTGFVRASGAESVLAGVFVGRHGIMILAAAAVGAITPICGVGVLPVIASLLAAGVPLAPIMAFWLSSPITDPAMLAITAGTLGLAFAAAKTGLAFAIGLAGGFATEAVVARGGFSSPLRLTGKALPSAACEASCAPAASDWRFWRDRQRRRIFYREALRAALMMVKWLALAFALESLLRAYLPAEIIADHVGTGSAWAIPIAVLIGAPLYVDGYAALPLVRGLMDLGLAPGAAMAFLIAGGITSLYASVAVIALVRLPVFLWYLAIALGASLLSGYAFEAAMAL